MLEQSLKVINPKRLGTDRIPAERITLHGRGNYKPNIGVLADGELLLFALHQHFEDLATGGSYTTHSLLYRSRDGGRTWSRGRHMRFFGHEPSVTVIRDVVFVLTHFLSSKGYTCETLADEDYTYDILYRSVDRGETWETIPLKYEMFPGAEKGNMAYTRNVFELADGRLFLGMGIGSQDFACYSEDLGRSWQNRRADVCRQRFEKGYPWAVFGESVVFSSPSGRLMMLSRMGLAHVRFEPPLPFLLDMPKDTGIDHYDGEILFESKDAGLSWEPLRAVGFPALMYPGVVSLPGEGLLVNYTVREVPPPGTGAVHPHIGVQAVLADERADGCMDFSMSEDVIVIDDQTHGRLTSGGGFGRTVMLADGTLITPYSTLWADADVIRMVENEEYLDPEVFNRYGAMLEQPLKFAEHNKTEEMLRLSFAMMWAFHGLMNKAGIRTDVVRWRLPELA